jgi:hypothetical protein
MNFKPKNEKELLAWDIANNLNDITSLHFYLSLANRYPAGLLRKALGATLEVPSARIRKSRGALFNHLVQQYAKENSRA